ARTATRRALEPISRAEAYTASAALMVPEEFAHGLHVPLPFLPHRQMGTVREDRELRASDPSMNGPSDARGDLIILAARDQRGDLDLRKLIRGIPVPEGTLAVEVGGFLLR